MADLYDGVEDRDGDMGIVAEVLDEEQANRGESPWLDDKEKGVARRSCELDRALIVRFVTWPQASNTWMWERLFLCLIYGIFSGKINETILNSKF